jgi:hypothetical protein
MSDAKISELSAVTSLVNSDIMPVVINVGSAPLNKKITIANLAADLKDAMGFDTDDIPVFGGLSIEADDTPGSLVLKRSTTDKYKLLWWKTGAADEWVLGTRSFGTAALTLFCFDKTAEYLKCHADQYLIEMLADKFEYAWDATYGATFLRMKNPSTAGQYGETCLDMQTVGAHLLVGVCIPGSQYPNPADGAWDGDGYLWLTDTYSMRMGVDNYEIMRISKNHNIGIGLGTVNAGDGGTGTCWCFGFEPPEKVYVDLLSGELIGFGSYTDGSNYAYGTLKYASGKIIMSGKTAGSGADNIDIELTPIGTGKVILPTLAAANYYLRIDANGNVYASAT